MIKDFEIKLDEKGELENWAKPITSKFGLYVFPSSSEILRIGETASGCERIRKGFREPLRRNLRGKDRKNYLAYSWRENFAGSSIFLDFFKLDEDPFSDNYLRRALEAEVTFQLRINMGHWPRQMSEIHFQERFRCLPFVVSEVSRILLCYGFRYRSDV